MQRANPHSKHFVLQQHSHSMSCQHDTRTLDTKTRSLGLGQQSSYATPAVLREGGQGRRFAGLGLYEAVPARRNMLVTKPHLIVINKALYLAKSLGQHTNTTDAAQLPTTYYKWHKAE